ncbi:hypothetical protein BGZ95_005384 [Linnemannia exigua]|uniref:Large-conductance mechanosensitive channel n=1 Tax=Linnemannia exigua TaxID=604196 RepID=A0AAD4H924_9FUNG|nr:hypothetical protein BGZ95_005384 [Linnemannia exigua]
MPVQDTVNHGISNAAQFGQGMFKKSRGFLQDFKDFINKGNAFDLAVAFILSAAFAAVIKSLVEDIITPLFGLANNRNLDEMFVVLRCGTTCKYHTRALAQADGAGKSFHFMSTSAVKLGLFLFVIVKLYYGMRRKVQVKDKACPYCCKDVNGTAARCPHCTSWLEIDVQRRVESEYKDNKTTLGTGERGLSSTTLGTSNGILKEKGSMEVMNDSKMTGAGAGAAVGSGAINTMYNNNSSNIVTGNNMNNGYMSNQHNPYTNPLPGQLQGQKVYDGIGMSQLQDQRSYDGRGEGHQKGYDGMGVSQPPGQRGYDGMGVGHQSGFDGLGVDPSAHSEGEGEHETGIGKSSSSKPKAP